MNTVIITYEDMQNNSTSNSVLSFTNLQLKALGVNLPLKKGWLTKLIGTEISEESYNLFLKYSELGKQKYNNQYNNQTIFTI